MKKLLLTLVAAGSLVSVSPSIRADSAESRKDGITTAAYAKTAFDVLSYPLVPVITVGLIGKGLTGLLTNEFVGKDLAWWVAAFTAVGLGCAAGSMIRTLYVKVHKLWGYSDSEISELCAESYGQQAWVFAQVGTIAWLLSEYRAWQKEREREKERRERQSVTYGWFRI